MTLVDPGDEVFNSNSLLGELYRTNSISGWRSGVY